MELKTTLRQAIEVAMTHPEGDRELVTHAMILGAHLKWMQRLMRDRPDFPASEVTDLLEMFVERHGIPHDRAVLKSLRDKHLEVAVLLAAFMPDGEISAGYLQQELLPQARNEFVDLFYRQAVGGLGVEIEAVDNLDDLLNDENVVLNEGMLYPRFFYRHKNRFEVKDEFLRQRSQETDPRLQQKLERQIEFLDSLPFRTIEDLCQGELPLTSPLLSLDTIAEFPGIQKYGSLSKREDGVFEMFSLHSPRLAISKESIYIVNYLNKRPLTDDPTSGKKGVNSKKGQEFIADLEASFNQWLPSSVYRQEIENRFNQFFNSFIPVEESHAPFFIEKLSPPEGKQPLPHQWQDCRSLLQTDSGGGAFLAVGLGKTLITIMTILAGKQAGKWQRPCVVVPKSLIANWYSEVLAWTKDVRMMVVGVSLTYWDKDQQHPAREIPGTTIKRDRKTGLPVKNESGNYILKVSKKTASSISGAIAESGGEMEISSENFESQARLVFSEDSAGVKAAKLEELAARPRGYYDLVLTIPISGCKDIPLSPQMEYELTLEMAARGVFGTDRDTKYLGKESIGDRITRLVAQVKALDEYGKRERLEKRHTAIVAQRGQKNAKVFWEDLKFDALFVDEAHQVCNACKPDAYQGVRGLNVNPSQIAHDMQVKAAYTRSIGGAVFALTATPIRNNIADLYSLMRLFADEELCAIGIKTLDDFLSVFADIQTVAGIDMSGTLKEKETLVGLKLVPELKRLVSKYCVVRDRNSMAHLYPEARNIDHLVPMTPIQSYLYQLGLERMEKGLELQSQRDFEALESFPNLHPFSVWADLGKLAFPNLYQSTTIYGDRFPEDKHELKDVAMYLGECASELNLPIQAYLGLIQESAYEMAIALAEETHIDIFGVDGDFSEEFKALEATFLAQSRSNVGDLPSFLRKEYGLDWRNGSRETVMGVTYELEYHDLFHDEERPVEKPRFEWRWNYVEGELEGDRIFTSPKIEKTADLCELYYRSGSIELQQPDGSMILTTPYHLFSSAEETEQKWREIVPGKEYPSGKVVSVSRGNVVIFCDFVGEGEMLFQEIAAAMVKRGIPRREIGFVCGGGKKSSSEEDGVPLSRQSVADWFNAGMLFAAIGSSGVMSEGLNLQGRVYPAVATIHLTLPWNQSNLDQRNGRVGRQGNGSAWIDQHYLLSPRSTDPTRIDLIRRKKGVGDSFTQASDEENLEIETVSLTLDTLSEMLSFDPVAIRKRRAIEEARIAKLSEERSRQANRKRLARYFNQLMQFLKHKAYNSADVPKMREALEVDRQFLLNTFDGETGSLLSKIPEDGKLELFVTSFGDVYQIGDWIKSSHGHLFRIWDVVVTDKGEIEIHAILAHPGNTYSGDLYKFSLHEFAWSKDSRERWKTTSRSRIEEKLFFPMYPKTSLSEMNYPYNKRKAELLFFEKIEDAETLEVRLSRAYSYRDILVFFSDKEMPQHRQALCDILARSGGDAAPVLYWTSNGRLKADYARSDWGEMMAVPSDPGFKDEYCLHLALHAREAFPKTVNQKFDSLADLCLWPLGLNSWNAAKEGRAIGSEYAKNLGLVLA